MKEFCLGPKGDLLNLSGFQAFGADPKRAVGAIHEEFNALKVWEESALGDTGNLFPDATFFLRHTPSGDSPSCNRTFSTEIAYFSHNGVSYHTPTVRSSKI